MLDVLVHALAEYEALRSTKGAFLRFRRWELRRMQVRLGRQFWIGPSFFLHRKSAFTVGERFSTEGSCRILNYCPIDIGDDFLAAEGLMIVSASHDPLTLECLGQPVKVGARVWCGARVTILGGVTIGDDVVIGAGSVVTQDIPSNSIAVGVPAKVVKPLDRDPSVELWNSFPAAWWQRYREGEIV